MPKANPLPDFITARVKRSLTVFFRTQGHVERTTVTTVELELDHKIQRIDKCFIFRAEM